MDHAEALERLADLALEPARLAGLEDDARPAAAALRAHLGQCSACRKELAAWRRTHAALRAATAPEDGTGGGRLADLGRGASAIRPPDDLRARTLALAARDAAASRERRDRAAAEASPPVAPAAGRSAGRLRAVLPMPAWLALAAVLALVFVTGGLLFDRDRQLQAARTSVAELAATTASWQRILAQPVHQVAVLRTTDGTAAGTLAWSASELVVVASLPVPAAGAVYRCWVEWDGTRTAIGTMTLDGTLGYWAGPLDGWAATLAPGGRFGVSLEPASGGSGGTAPVLTGQL